jgi:hypothetical protein
MGWDADMAEDAFWELPYHVQSKLRREVGERTMARSESPFQTSSQIFPFYVNDVCMVPDCGCAGTVHR